MKTRNSVLLDSFVRYCKANPDQRFWQALRNWAAVDFILFSRIAPYEFDEPEGWLKDTFHMEGRNG